MKEQENSKKKSSEKEIEQLIPEKNRVFTQEFRHPVTGELGTFNRYEDNWPIYLTDSGEEFVTHTPTGEWEKGRWDKVYQDTDLSEAEFAQVEEIRLWLLAQATETWNHYNLELELGREEAKTAIYEVILPWERHAKQRWHSVLEELYKAENIYDGHARLSYPIRHWWPMHLQTVKPHLKLLGRPPLAELALVTFEAEKKGNTKVAQMFRNEVTARELWDAELRAVRDSDDGFWHCYLYREPVNKAGWAVGFGGGFPTWREWSIPFSSVEVLLKSVHPSVFLAIAEQIESGALEKANGPLETQIRKALITKEELKRFRERRK